MAAAVGLVLHLHPSQSCRSSSEMQATAAGSGRRSTKTTGQALLAAAKQQEAAARAAAAAVPSYSETAALDGLRCRHCQGCRHGSQQDAAACEADPGLEEWVVPGQPVEAAAEPAE